MVTEDELLAARRGVQNPCEKCGGWGRFHYPNTGTWDSKPGDGKIVGHGFTWGTCDACWGSGDRDRPGTDLRKLTEQAERGRQLPMIDPPIEVTYGLEWRNASSRHIVAAPYQYDPALVSPAPIWFLGCGFMPNEARTCAALLLAAANEAERNRLILPKRKSP